MKSSMFARAGALFVCVALVAACGGDKEDKKDERVKLIPQTTKETRTEDGLILLTFDSNNDESPDVAKYYREIADPDDPSVTVRRLVRVDMDVNADGKINVERVYTKLGKLESESLDSNLDGRADVISYYDKGALVRKQMLDEETGKILATRYYAEDKLIRVERDTTGDGKTDYWEYYEQGVLDRIGRDFNADGRADSWQKR